MSSGTEIIQEALGEIGAHSVASPAPAESVSVGMAVLNSMLQQWFDIGIDLGIMPLKNPGDELGEPMGARMGIVKNLAIVLAPKFDNGVSVVSQDLAKQSRNTYGQIRKMYQSITIPKKTVSSLMPLGSGHDRWVGRERTFAGDDFKLDG